MSLQVWLPLRGNLDNYGLTNVTVTNNGATVNASGKIGSCYSFNGTNQYIDCGDYTSGKQNRNISICFWIYPQDVSGNKLCAGSRHGSNQRLYFGILGGYISYGAGSNGWSSWTGCEVETNKWYHIALVFDNNRVGNFYINGVLKHTRNTGSFSFTGDFDLGRGNNGESYRQALFNDLRIYDHALSTREVKEIAKGLVLHYQLDDPEIMLSKCTNINWNQLINQNNFPASISQNGVTGVVNKENGSITLNGDCTAYNVISIGHSAVSVTSGHKYVFKGCPTDGSYVGSTSGTYDYRINANGSYLTEIGNGLLWTATYTGTMNVYIRVAQGYSCHDIVFYPKLYDLTQMFGAGNEPTLEEFLLMFPDNIYKYDAGTTKNLSKQIPDSSGYLNNGTITGVATLNNGSPRYGKCTMFSSSATNYIRIPNAALAGPYSNKELTFSFWINTQQTGNRHMIFGIVGSYNTNIELYTANQLRVYWAGTPDWYPGITCTQNEWTHISVIVTSTYIKCYKNGVLVGTNNTAPNWAGCTQDLLIGSDQRIGSYFLGSKLSDFRIYSTVLSAEDIKELYDTAAYIHNTGNLSGYEISETAKNLLQYENTLMYTNPVNTSVSRGKYVDRNGSVAMCFKANDTYFAANDERNSLLLYGFFKANTRYLFDLWMDMDDVVYDNVNRTGGFTIVYTDGTTSGNTLVATGTMNPYTGWQHKVFVTPADKSVKSISIYYWTSAPFYVRADSCIVELSETDIAKTGVVKSGQFIENTDVAFIGKATFNSNNIIEI